tara:strand:- start:44 stop:520 length:477 start_codon:yes stop_codon:yes gene_type:complete
MDLTPSALEREWQERAPELIGLLSAMGALEPWTPRGDEALEDQIVRLGEALSPDRLRSLAARPDAAVPLLGYLPAEVALHLCHVLEATSPGFLLEGFRWAVNHAGSPGPHQEMARAFRDRIMLIFRANALEAFLSEDRLAGYLAFMERTVAQHGGLYA